MLERLFFTEAPGGSSVRNSIVDTTSWQGDQEYWASGGLFLSSCAMPPSEAPHKDPLGDVGGEEEGWQLFRTH